MSKDIIVFDDPDFKRYKLGGKSDWRTLEQLCNLQQGFYPAGIKQSLDERNFKWTTKTMTKRYRKT